MRIASIRLSRYGQFEEADFAFAKTGPADLHLVVGPNEAGKTTLKHALVDFLFGVPSRSPPYAFRYDRRQILLEAGLERAGRAFSLQRTTGRASLSPVEEGAVLAEALGDMDRDIYLRTQAFSHHEMRVDSDALHTSKGDLRDLLMRDAGGLAHAVSALDALEKEAGNLFDRRKNRSSEYMKLEKAWQEAQARYDAHELSAVKHADLRRNLSDAETRLHTLRRDEKEAEIALDRLARLIELSPRVARAEALKDALADDGVPRLAPNAVERLRAAEDEPTLREQLRQAEARRGAIDEALAALVPDEAVLTLAPEIEAVEARSIRLSAAEEERGRMVSAEEGALAAAARTARGLGLAVGTGDAAALTAALVPSIARAALRRHLASRDGLERAVVHARELLESGVVELPEEQGQPDEAVEAALAQARALGEIRTRWANEVSACRDARTASAAADEAAAGDPATDAAPPPVEDGRAAEKRIVDAENGLERQEERVAVSAEDVARAREILTAKRQADLPTEERLAALRAARDALWGEIRAGRPAETAGDEYEARVGAADRASDDRFAHAEALTDEKRAATALAEAEALHASRVERRDQLRAARDEARRVWQARLEEAGLARVPADYAAWFARRKAQRDAAAALDEAQGRLQRLRARFVQVLEAAEAALGRPPSGASDGADLVPAIEDAITLLEARQDALRSANAEAKAARDAYEKAERDRPAREKALAKAESDLAAWTALWRRDLAAAGIDADIDAERLDALFEGMEAIEDALDEAGRAAARVRDTDRDLAAFGAETQRLAGLLGEAEVGGPRILARRLVERLRRAEQDAARRAERHRERETAERAVRAAAEAHESVRAAILADLDAAGLPADAPLAALQQAARASDERHQMETSLAEILAEIAAKGFAWDEIVAALADESEADRSASRAALADRLAALKADIAEAGVAVGSARERLHRAEADSASGTAAEAAFERNTIAIAMADVAAEAIARRLEVAVLRAARDAFAAENQSPVLERAAENFTLFTGGAYDRLVIDDGPDGGFLRAHRPADDQLVDVTQMSAGTRDQLVVAVRLAAAVDCALPFLADDLFVNADETRTAAGFRLLAGLAEGRQVIYFTHHSHVADVARAALGENLSIVRMS
ncbi:AAA family ATPase [Acuticoccus kandeliae]|uniref:AAA family ATPase n=1 Tax=Acuticoccus kandeliae TaxID=2073160 RepID=UPI000D3E1662|nr:AAA family ATPase [Acuticoccus kandeliae]